MSSFRVHIKGAISLTVKRLIIGVQVDWTRRRAGKSRKFDVYCQRDGKGRESSRLPFLLRSSSHSFSSFL